MRLKPWTPPVTSPAAKSPGMCVPVRAQDAALGDKGNGSTGVCRRFRRPPSGKPPADYQYIFHH